MSHDANGNIDPNNLDFKGKVNYWTGSLTLAIGEGKMRGKVYDMVFILTSDAYKRGLEDGKKEQK
jgi:hypothetical protein